MKNYNLLIYILLLMFGLRLSSKSLQAQEKNRGIFVFDYLHTHFEFTKRYFYHNYPLVIDGAEGEPIIHLFRLEGEKQKNFKLEQQYSQTVFAESIITRLMKEKRKTRLQFEEELQIVAPLPKLKYIILYLGKGYKKLHTGLPLLFESNKSVEAIHLSADYRYLEKSYFPKNLQYLFIETWHRKSKKYRKRLLEKLSRLDSLKSLIFVEFVSRYFGIYDTSFFGVLCDCAKTRVKRKSLRLIQLPSEIQNFHNLEELDINVNLLNKENIEILAKLSKLKRLAVYACPEEKEFDYELLTKLNFLEGLYIKTGFEMDCPNYTRFKAKLQKYLPQTYIDYFEAEDED